jgi:hypothetical protein
MILVGHRSAAAARSSDNAAIPTSAEMSAA